MCGPIAPCPPSIAALCVVWLGTTGLCLCLYDPFYLPPLVAPVGLSDRESLYRSRGRTITSTAVVHRADSLLPFPQPFHTHPRPQSSSLEKSSRALALAALCEQTMRTAKQWACFKEYLWFQVIKVL